MQKGLNMEAILLQPKTKVQANLIVALAKGLNISFTQTKMAKINEVQKALQEVRKGDVVKCKSVDDMFSKLEKASL